MSFRILVAVAAVAVSACSQQPLAPLPVHSSAAPSQGTVAQARSACPDARFLTVAPHNNTSYWFKCGVE